MCYSSNLLIPRGVNLIPSILIVRIFQGGEFPQMDMAVGGKNKQYADPYCIVQFAGQSRKTSIQERNYDPVWNEEMQFKTYVSFILELSLLPSHYSTLAAGFFHLFPKYDSNAEFPFPAFK